MSGVHQQFQPIAPGSQQSQRSLDTAGRLRQILGVGSRELLRTDEIARDYKFPSAEAARKFLKRHDVPVFARGRIVLVDRRDFDRAMERCRFVRPSRKRA